jgi:diaminohydroxyphosphoribosylaminopyrimidine deaminase/5-amino-6-(5-phosphoribosylamino)uracil reductase
LRYEHDAVMVGAGTVTIDDPLLTVRPFKPRAVPYTRIVIDSHGRIARTAKVLRDQRRFPTIVATTDLMPERVRSDLVELGVKVMECTRTPDGHVDVDELLSRLGAQGMLSILCEGGPTLAAALAAASRVDEFAWLLAPRLLAGIDAVDVLIGTAEIPLHIESVKRIGDDWLVTARRAG